jgi:GNAT superfamily N-acetyltransferase
MPCATIRIMLIRDVRHQNGLDLTRQSAAVIRREVRPGDPDAIVAMHDRLYRAEHGMDHRFTAGVAATVEAAMASGWPAGGGAWIVERDGRFAGSVALTGEGQHEGKVRWVLLEPELRGSGLGRRLVGEAVARARELGMRRLTLDTFSELRSAAAIYRDLGFRVVSEEDKSDWGPPIVYQHYELELSATRRPGRC